MHKLVVLIAALGLTTVSAAHADTPVNEMVRPSSVTITSDDVQAAMSAEERRRFDELNRKYRAHRQQMNAIPDPDVAATIREKLEELKDQRDREFRIYRGLGNQTVLAYGKPPPSASDIVAIVVAARRGGGDGVLYPHWERTVRLVNNEVLNGPIQGSHSPPDSGSSGVPAGPEARARIVLDGNVSPLDPVTDAQARKCGPRPAGAGLVCKCGFTANDVFGAVTAVGAKDCQWVEQ